MNEIETALQKWNVNLPTGTMFGPDRTLTLRADGQLTSADAYRRLVVVERAGSPVHLDDLGEVSDSVEDDKTANWFVSPDAVRRSIVLAIQRQPGANTVEVADAVRKLIPTFKLQVPPSVNIEVLYDRSQSIRQSFDDVQFTMVLSLRLRIMRVLSRLRNVRVTDIPGLALPFPLVGTF